MTFKPEPPQPSPYVHRVVPMFLFRRIVRPDGNAQKSMTAPEIGIDRMPQKGLECQFESSGGTGRIAP